MSPNKQEILKPLSPAALEEYGALKNVTAPTGDFDPSGNWKHVYHIRLTGPPWKNDRGYLVVQRTTGAGTADARLSVKQVTLQTSGPVQRDHTLGLHVTKVELDCRDDMLSTPVRWSLSSRLYNAINDNEYPTARVMVQGRARNGHCTLKTGNDQFRRKLPARYTCLWSLFDALQRLPGKETPETKFALLQELDKLKDGQRLSYREETDISFGGRKIATTCYQHLGQGILPYRYYTGPAGRLLLAVSGQRAYILDPDAPTKVQKRIEWKKKQEAGQ